MTPAERRQFVRDHRSAVFGFGRRADGPAMSLVYYVVDPDDTILVSTTAGRAKARAVERTGKVSLCVLDEQWPPTYVQVYCDARVDADLARAADVMMRVGGAMAGAPLDESLRPIVEETATNEGRVTLRLTPYATFETPPRRGGSETAVRSASLPWHA